ANWNPDADGRIETLVVHGSTVYAGGQFNTIGGQPRGDLAALDAVTGVATAWNPAITGTNAGVNVLQISGNTLYVGGFFTAAGGQSRRSLAAFNLTTGLVTGWNPSANPTGLFPGRIDRMLADDPVVYVAGGF